MINEFPFNDFLFNLEFESQGEIVNMALPTMTVTQQYLISIQPVDGKGKPAPIDGPAVFASSDESIVKVVAQADGLSALVVAQGVGDYSISASADADLGAGVETITASDTGTVTQGRAKSIAFTTGPVEEQP